MDKDFNWDLFAESDLTIEAIVWIEEASGCATKPQLNLSTISEISDESGARASTGHPYFKEVNNLLGKEENDDGPSSATSERSDDFKINSNLEWVQYSIKVILFEATLSRWVRFLSKGSLAPDPINIILKSRKG